MTAGRSSRRRHYSAAQRDAIMCAVKKGCPQPALFDFDSLLREADRYQTEIAAYLSPSQYRAAWKRAARSVGKARDDLARVRGHTLIDSFLWEAVREMMARIPDQGESDWGDFQVIELLNRIQEAALRMSRGEFSVREIHGPHPRVVFSEAALDYWIEAGGLIRKSRASGGAGTIGGPTVRYLEAVLKPMMGDDAPGPERLRQIIDQYAKDVEDMVLRDPEFAAGLEAAQNGRDADTAVMGVLTQLTAIGRDLVRRQARKKPRRRRADRLWARRLVRGQGRAPVNRSPS